MKQEKKFPKFWIGVYILTAISAILYIVFQCSVAFSDWFNRSISAFGRALLAAITNPLPFSLAELVLILIPVWLVLLIYIAWRYYSHSARAALHYLGMLLGGACIVVIIFIWNYAPGYFGTTLDKKLGLERKEVAAEELFQTAEILRAELDVLSEEIVFVKNDASVMPYSYAEMNDKLSDAYKKFAEKNDCIVNHRTRLKPVMLSDAMSYTHITGVYTFFTGEANINVKFPDYTVPYTAAHELAHQRGIAREDEANFIAFLVCMESDDPYIRYSALLNVYEYVIYALASADPSLYQKSYAALPIEIKMERVAYSKFFDKYRENIAATVSDATNDAYLQSQGAKEGAKSYNMVVDLAVAYYRPHFR